jgi:hypothetical protein
MSWNDFAAALETGFKRDGYDVHRLAGPAADFEIAKEGRRAVVSGKRWKVVATGVEPLRELEGAKNARDRARVDLHRRRRAHRQRAGLRHAKAHPPHRRSRAHHSCPSAAARRATAPTDLPHKRRSTDLDRTSPTPRSAERASYREHAQIYQLSATLRAHLSRENLPSSRYDHRNPHHDDKPPTQSN